MTQGPGATAAPRPEPDDPALAAPWRPLELHTRLVERPDSVDNLEWIDLPAGHEPLDLTRLEREYFEWVPRLTAGLVRPLWRGPGVSLGVEPLHRPVAIRLDAPRHDGASARTRPILGGMLAEPGGTFGFELQPRPAGTRLLVAVRGFRPRLPRWLYRRFQARLHVRSTCAFLRQVAREAAPEGGFAPRAGRVP